MQKTPSKHLQARVTNTLQSEYTNSRVMQNWKLSMCCSLRIKWDVLGSTYTERQNKLITSSEQHALKSKALKWIMIGDRLALVLLTKYISKNKRLIESEKIKIRWIHKMSFVKNHRNCSPPAHRALHGQYVYYTQYGGYITHHWNWMNSYSMFRIGMLSWRFSVSSFCDLLKMTFCYFTAFFSFLKNVTFWFFTWTSWGEL